MRPLLRLLPALLLATCTSPVDPDLARDAGLFSCAASADCGEGWECKPRFPDGGACFRLGVCLATETCNGLDDTCDGRIDETFDLATDPLHCGRCGHACAAGTGCVDAGCVEVACGNRLDDDDNGLVDCLDLACDGQRCELDGGRCGLRVPDAGFPDGGASDGGAPDGGASDGGAVRGCWLP